MSAELLRRAAGRLDALAKDARAGQWFADEDEVRATWRFGAHTVAECTGSLPEGKAANAAYIATMHPGVGKALAELLRSVTETGVSESLMRNWLERDRSGQAALALARQILGES